MTETADIERIMNERSTQRTNVPAQHSQLIQKLKDETTDEMKEILKENSDLQDVRTWLHKKTKYLNRILETERIKPATSAYIIIKQIGDAAAHFVAEYRANKKIA